MFLCPRRWLWRVCLGCIAGALVLRVTLHLVWHTSWLAPYALMPCRMDALAAGGFIAAARRTFGDERSLRRVVRPAAACALLLLAVTAAIKGRLNDGNPWMYTIGFTALAIAFAGLVHEVSGPGRSPLRRVFENRLLRVLGKYSYAIYVLHPLLRDVVDEVLPVERLIARLGSLGAVLWLAVAFFVVLAAAWASWHLFEKRFLTLKRYFEYEPRRERGRAAA